MKGSPWVRILISKVSPVCVRVMKKGSINSFNFGSMLYIEGGRGEDSYGVYRWTE